MTCLLPTPSSMGRASLHVRPCIKIYHIPDSRGRKRASLLLAFMHSRLTSWKVISLYPISKHWHWEKSGMGLALYYRGLPRILLNSYRSKEASNLLRLRPREAIPHSKYPGRQRCRASFFSLSFSLSLSVFRLSGLKHLPERVMFPISSLSLFSVSVFLIPRDFFDDWL